MAHPFHPDDDAVGSAIHGAVALLHTLHADHATLPDALASWTAVYGTTLIEPSLSELNEQLHTRRPRTIPDAFMAGALAMGDALCLPTSELVSQQLAAHAQIESELLRRLAEVTGRSVDDVLAYLDVWATSRAEDEEPPMS